MKKIIHGKEYNIKPGTDLSGADLSGADLTRGDLTGTDLTGANLAGADLTGANLYGGNLTGANLTEAYLIEADLTGADLTGADLTGADLTGSSLSGSYLSKKGGVSSNNLSGATMPSGHIMSPKALANLKKFDFVVVKKFKKEIHASSLLEAQHLLYLHLQEHGVGKCEDGFISDTFLKPYNSLERSDDAEER